MLAAGKLGGGVGLAHATRMGRRSKNQQPTTPGGALAALPSFPAGHVPRRLVCTATGVAPRQRSGPPPPSSRGNSGGRGMSSGGNGYATSAPPRPADRRARPAPDNDAGVALDRSDLVNKQVITRTTGTKLGVVSQMWVDTDNWEVVALDVRPNLLVGELDCVLLSSLRQVGDVILVHDESAIEPELSLYGFYSLVGSEIVTETGEYLGKVRDFQFNPDDARVSKVVFDSLGLPLVPSAVVSTYTFGVNEVVSVGPERVIVREGCETRLQQLTAGVLQRLALADAPWEEREELGYGVYDEEYDYYGREDPYRPYGNDPQREQQQPQPQPQQQYQPPPPPRREREPAPQQRVSIPLYERAPPPPAYRVKDMDGQYGEAPPPRREPQPQQQEGGVPFNEWVVEEEREVEMEGAGGGYAASAGGKAGGGGRGGGAPLPPPQGKPRFDPSDDML